MLIGIILAQHVPGWRPIRTLLFLPFLISGAALATVFAMVYNPRYGLLNEVVTWLGLPARDWLLRPTTALAAVIATFVFIIGFQVVLVMAEIISIPHELYEAAQLDGAGPVRRLICNQDWVRLTLIEPSPTVARYPAMRSGPHFSTVRNWSTTSSMSSGVRVG